MWPVNFSENRALRRRAKFLFRGIPKKDLSFFDEKFLKFFIIQISSKFVPLRGRGGEIPKGITKDAVYVVNKNETA